MSVFKICAFSWVELTNVVVRTTPFQVTLEPLTKLVPLTMSVKAALPALMDVGFRLVRAGCGLLTVNAFTFDTRPSVPVPDVTTLTFAVLAVATAAAGTVAVSFVVLTKVVVSFVVFQYTLELGLKRVPVT